MLEGEDQHSINQAVTAIQAEYKKWHPDKALLADKLKMTVAYRHKMCLESSTNEVLTTFPALCQYLYVSINLTNYGSLMY